MNRLDVVAELEVAPVEALIVDDDDQGRNVLARILRRSGYVCHLASDAPAARCTLELMRPDLVLSDVRMPLEQAVLDRTAELADTVARLERSEGELRRVTQDTILALTRAIERRDAETANHIERVSLYATVLARRLRLPDEQCEMIREASPMHDVGKVGIPDGILLKPGPVTAAEFSVIKQHVALGHSILSRSEQPLLRLAADVAETHHERWDGRGYLQGLRGEEIPLAGRITAIADTFDALVSRRVYKPPVALDHALDVIEQGRGTQFDPELVDLFLECRPEVADIVAAHPDG